MYNFKDIPLDDEKTWKLFHEGDTKGIFQLETKLGQDWSRRLKPSSIYELACLGALLRPGCLQSGITESFIKRKFGEEEIIPLHPALTEILKDTYQLIVFQEQIIKIGVEIGGMSEEDADFYLRKGIGKKIASIIEEAKTKFIEGATKRGLVTKDDAIEIFNIIEKFNRYGFNACLTPDTIIETKHGFKILADISTEDYVKGLTDDLSGFEWIKVKDIYNNGPQDVVEITMDSGKIIKCTLNHQFLCSDNNTYPLYYILQNNLQILCDD